MKSFLFKIFVFLLLLFVVDRIIGYGFQYMVNHSKGGYVKHHQFILDECEDQILIFGSSRAIHHYNPTILSDSLGMTCYNCGQDGNGVILNYGEWLQMKNRYAPKFVIYDVSMNFDIASGDNHRFLGWLKLFYDKDGVKDIFESIDSTETIKMNSLMYRYNYNPLQIITDYYHPIHHFKNGGFLPLKRKAVDRRRISDNKDDKIVVDSMKISYLEKFINSVESPTEIIMVVSPSWTGFSEDKIKPIEDLCKKYEITFYNFSNDPIFLHNDSLFADGSHLNAKGADMFTKELSKLLKKEIETK